MNYQKLDAALAIALADIIDPQAPCLTIFVHWQGNLTANARQHLEALGIQVPPEEPPSILPAPVQSGAITLSMRQIDRLSEQAWVKMLRLSQMRTMT